MILFWRSSNVAMILHLWLKISSVIFIPFSKANQDTEKYKGWIQACSRQNFDILFITKYTYVCSAHFVQDQGHSDSFKFILNHHISDTTAI